MSSNERIKLTLEVIYREADNNDIEIEKIPLNEVIENIYNLLNNETELYRNEIFSRFVYECYDQGLTAPQEIIDFDVSIKMNITDEDTDQIFFEISKEEFLNVLDLKGIIIQKEYKEDIEKLIGELLEEVEQQVKDWYAIILDKMRTIADRIS